MTETARMYGGSLYDLAAEEGLDERILGELDGVTALLNGDAEYLHLLSIPSIPKKERCALLDEAFRGQVHLYVLNFMKLLCEKGALRELPGCARAYRLRYNEAHGITPQTIQKSVRALIAISKKVAADENALDKDPESMSKKELEKHIADIEKKMKKAAAELNFEAAAEYRDKLIMLKNTLRDVK